MSEITDTLVDFIKSNLLDDEVELEPNSILKEVGLEARKSTRLTFSQTCALPILVYNCY